MKFWTSSDLQSYRYDTELSLYKDVTNKIIPSLLAVYRLLDRAHYAEKESSCVLDATMEDLSGFSMLDCKDDRLKLSTPEAFPSVDDSVNASKIILQTEV